MNKILNNKIIVWLGQLIIPSILISIPFTINFDHLGVGLFVLSIVLSILLTVFYIFLIWYSYEENNISVLPTPLKKIHSKYGNFFLKEVSRNEYAIYYNIYVNKYIIFLTKVNEDDIRHLYTENLSVLEKKINRILDKKYSYLDKFREFKKSVSKWNGSVDEVTRRDRNINSIINK